MALTERPTPHPSPHCSARPPGVAISAIILHDTVSYSAMSALNWFANPDAKVSAHVVIDRDGSVWRVLSDDVAAWHAGVSTLHGRANVNHFSLGVEIVDVDGPTGTAYTATQLEHTALWCAQRATRYGIPLNRIVGHDMIAPGRKVDPGADFPWATFLRRVAALQGV